MPAKRALMAAILATALLPACASAPREQLNLLESWMNGSFSSAEQHLADLENLYDIRLCMVSIWPDRSDGPWLYVEQAAADRLERPYRQRVYHLADQPDGNIASDIYLLPEDPLRFAGAWRGDNPLAELTPADLALRDGCTMILRKKGRAFVGSTVGQDCASSLRGASYATSEATIQADQLLSWDRGYDEAHRQVWGATRGGYVFKKLAEPAPGE